MQATDWTAVLAEAREAREASMAQARTALIARHAARCDAPHDWLAAPSGRGEVVERLPIIGGRGDSAQASRRMGMTARHALASMAQAHRARRSRLDTLNAAREARTTALNVARRMLPPVSLTPVEVEPREVNSTRIAARPHDLITAVEALILTRDRNAQAWAHVASSEPNRDGRGTVDAAPDAVNGTEVRYAPRWRASRRSAITTERTTTALDGTTTTERVPIDWTCYRVSADGTRTALVSTTTARKRKRQSSAKGAADARLRAIAGTLGVEAQG